MADVEPHPVSANSKCERHPVSPKYMGLKLKISLIRFILAMKVKGLSKKVDRAKGVEVQAVKIPSKDKGRLLPAFLYRPESASKDEKLPVHINLHGGGFCIAMHGVPDEGQCRKFAKRLNANILDVGYRVAPEHPWPAGLEDVIDTINFCHSNPELYNFDATRISIGGNSAGANLALSASHLVGPSIVSSTALLYPIIDFCPPDADHTREPPCPTFRSGFILDRDSLRFCESCYLLDKVDRKDPVLNAFYADVKSFPKRMQLCAGTGDPFYLENDRFVKKLQAEGHPDIKLLTLEGEGHAFDKVPKPGVSVKYQEEAYEALCQCIEKGWKDAQANEKV